MKIITFLALFAGLVIPYAAAAPAPGPGPSPAPDVSLNDGIVVKYYPYGLPPGLYPGEQLTSRSMDVEKRDPQASTRVEIDAPGINGLKVGVVGVYACNGINFSGFCVYIRSFPGQCVQPPQSVVTGASDTTSSVGPDRPWKCRFFV